MPASVGMRHFKLFHMLAVRCQLGRRRCSAYLGCMAKNRQTAQGSVPEPKLLL